MFFIDLNGNIKQIPKQCLLNKNLLNEYMLREKYGK